MFGSNNPISNQDSIPLIDSVAFVLEKDDPFLRHLDEVMVAEFSKPWSFEYDTTSGDSASWANEAIPNPSDSTIKARLQLLNDVSPIELTYNDKTLAFINLYAVRKRDLTSRFIGLSEFYFPMIEAHLDKYQMPQELKHLAIVESALNSTANSRAGAKGLWQFMYTTGIIYGLEVNSYIDDRFDPIKSTEAACQYLSFLYKIYSDWNLALAAYNCGPGNVNKAIRRSGGKRDYWEIYPYLPRETRGYVPAFIAVNYVMNYHEEHGIKPTPSGFSHYDCDTVLVSHRVSLQHLSKTLHLPYEDIEHLNPQYKLSIIPKMTEPQVLRLPRGELANFIINEQAVYELYAKAINKPEEEEAQIEQIKKYDVYRVSHGDYLGKIASRYNVSVRDIKDWNNLRSDNLKIGQRLTIYHSSSAPSNLANSNKPAPTIKTKSEGKYEYYEIQRGDTLWDIAKAKGISTTELKSMNRDINEKNMKPGDKIIVGKNG